MRLIVITAPDFLQGEAEVLTGLLERGADRLHLRKPEAAEEELAALIEALPARYRPQISLHDHFRLHARYGLGGLHLNGRNPAPPAGFRGLLSRSCHSLDEIAAYGTTADYLFLSPLFDSISKQGYRSGFTPEVLTAARRAGIITEKTIALGGIDASRLPLAGAWGFGGAALLGDLWSRYRTPADRETLYRRFEALRLAADRI